MIKALWCRWRHRIWHRTTGVVEVEEGKWRIYRTCDRCRREWRKGY
jgi:hypothetical protein